MPDLTAAAQNKKEDMKMQKEITVEAKVENLQKVLEFVDSGLEAAGCGMKVQIQVDVALEEMYVNIANYAYAPGTGTATIAFESGEKRIKITLKDSGTPYDPLAHEDPDITLSAEEREIGGLGIFLVKKNMDAVSYEYRDGKNIFVMEKEL